MTQHNGLPGEKGIPKKREVITAANGLVHENGT